MLHQFRRGQMGLAVILALHSGSLSSTSWPYLSFTRAQRVPAAISVGLCEFLLGFVFASPFWLVGLVPVHQYVSLALQLGTLASYGLVLASIPFLQLLHHSPDSQAGIATAVGWQSLCACVGSVSKTTGGARSLTSSHPALCAMPYFYLPSSRYVGPACWVGSHSDPLEYGRNDSGSSSFLGNSSRCKNFTETEVSRSHYKRKRLSIFLI